jgi:hypothetical protein
MDDDDGLRLNAINNPKAITTKATAAIVTLKLIALVLAILPRDAAVDDWC